MRRRKRGRARRRYRSPWWVGERWAVESFHNGEWQRIYTAKSKKTAEADARKWHNDTGKPVRVVPGPGHKTLRGR